MQELFTTLSITFLFIGLYRFLRFVTTPLFLKLGLYKYYSKMFFTVPVWKDVYEIHMGTSYDFFSLNAHSPRLLMQYLSEGLSKLADAIERGEVKPTIRFKGTIYYFSSATLVRFGFKMRPLYLWEKVVFTFNYLELCFLQSVMKRKIAFVNLKEIKVAYCEASDILSMKQLYESLNMSLMSAKKDHIMHDYHQAA